MFSLTATPERQDGHQKIIFMAAGPIRHKVKSSIEGRFEQEVQVHQFYDSPPLHLSQPEERPKITDVYRWIIENKKRTQRIMSDVIDNVREGRHPIVLTERRDHAETLNNLLDEDGIDSIILKGAMKAAERRRVEEHLHSAQVVVATGKYVGEGFDLPRLDTLLLAMPSACSINATKSTSRWAIPSCSQVNQTARMALSNLMPCWCSRRFPDCSRTRVVQAP